MIECVFTLDYEIYGDGTGSLEELVYQPTERLRDVFQKWDARFVNFVEVAEFEKIEECGTDPAVGMVRKQVRELYEEGHEIALHLHPQWCNARYEQGRWLLDYTEYNLCTLPRARITEVVQRSVDYLRRIVGSAFSPLSFRAGNWLFQPTATAAAVLAENHIKVDSSVFKGGLQHNHGLDYRPALQNGYHWTFRGDANQPDASGTMIEVPIYTEMVPSWKMPTSKRMGFGNRFGAHRQSARQKLNRVLDFLRFRYPLKLDFCRMTLGELTGMIERIVREDAQDPAIYKPIVAIGHSKDLVDLPTVEAFLSLLRSKGIAVSTFEGMYPKLTREVAGHSADREPAAEIATKASH